MSINPFAGLMAGFRSTRAEDEKPEDEAARAARRAEEDQKREEENARRAEEDERRQEEDARRAEEDGDEPEQKPDGKGKTKGADDKDQDPEADAEDDDSEAEEGMDDKEAKAFRRGLAIGRARENARSSRIFLTAAKGGRADLAATLAFTTRNTSAEAGRILGSAGAPPASRGRGLSSRMSERTDPRPGADAGSGGKKTGSKLADEMIAVGKSLGQMGRD